VKLPRIENYTTLRGDDLRRLVQRAFKALGCPQSLVYTWKSVTFRQSPDWQTFGWTWCEDGHVEINLCRGFTGTAQDVREAAQLLCHEIQHLQGLEHVDMTDPDWWTERVPWARGLKIRLTKKAQQAQALKIESQIRRLVDELVCLDTEAA